MTHSAKPHGQVLVLTGLAMVVLVGIAALVVDLGFSWMLRRHEQNAADPASLAAARWIPDYEATGDPAYGPSGNMRLEACAVARQNGFFADASDNTGCIPANDGDRAAALTVNYPPIGPSAGIYAGRSNYVQVIIQGSHPSFFGRIFGATTAVVATSAVSALDDGTSAPYSLIALDPSALCGTAKISGTTGGGGGGGSWKVSVGGAVHVNSTCGSPDTSGSGACEISDQGALRTDGGGGLEAVGDVFVAGACKGDPASVTGAGTLHENAVQIGDPLGDLGPPNLADYSAGSCDGVVSTPTSTGCSFSGGTHTLTPGIYYGGWKLTGSGTKLKLLPGIYIIAGGGIRQTGSGGELDSVEDPSTGDPAEVLIYSTDNPSHAAACAASWTNGSRCQGGISLNGGNLLLLEGISTIPRYKGMLIWQDADGSCPTDENACDIRLGGQTSMEIAGTIYAPDQEVMLDGGSSGTGIATVQIISWHWTITGDSLLTMPYDPADLLNLARRGLVR